MTKNEIVGEFYKRNHRKLCNFIKSYTPNQVEPADIVSQVFLIILEKVAQGDERFFQDDQLNFFYIYRACVNTALKVQRAANRINKVSIDDLELELEEDLVDHEKVRAELTLHGLVQDGMHDLHWYERTLVRMNVVEGLSMRKISRETGITLTSIKNSIRNAKESIKRPTQEDYTDWANGEFERIG